MSDLRYSYQGPVGKLVLLGSQRVSPSEAAEMAFRRVQRGLKPKHSQGFWAGVEAALKEERVLFRSQEKPKEGQGWFVVTGLTTKSGRFALNMHFNKHHISLDRPSAEALLRLRQQSLN